MLHFFAKRLREMQEVSRDERGFTLIELLVVMVIIAILAAIAIPAFLAQRERAAESTVLSDTRNAAAAGASCVNDTDAAGVPNTYDDDCDTTAQLDAYGLNLSPGVTITYGGDADTLTMTTNGPLAEQATYDSDAGRVILATP
jgi:type IV pilus assembly protein PilA